MTMLQHYYTSSKKGTSSAGGFQCKAISPGIHPEDLKVINSILSYRIPSSLDPKDISRHPVALRYQYLNGDKAILICSQSNGPDELGRPGNYFAHTVITSAQDFDLFPPILFWGHSFWRTRDSSDNLEIPPQPNFDLEPSLDFDRIWPFLQQGNRRDWFYKLLCAVMHYDKAKRPIVILDSDENIALWIMAVTFALPRAYRPFITFATYHHDPYQAPFMIIGTTADSRFRFSQDEYISYFILNANGGRISEVDDSVYARFICDHFDAESYESKLLEFFELCQELIPRVTNRGIADKLDVATNFYHAVRENRLPAVDPRTQDSIELFLCEIEQRPAMGEYMAGDLVKATAILREGIVKTPSEAIVQQYGRALNLLKKHDPNFAYRSQEDLILVLRLLINENELLASQLLRFCQQMHAQDNFADAVNRPEFIEMIVAKLPANNWRVHHLIWQYFGQMLCLTPRNKPFLTKLIEQALFQSDQLLAVGGEQFNKDAQILLTDLIQALPNENEKFLLAVAAGWNQRASSQAFVWLYTMLVGKLTLKQRESYRRYILSLKVSISLEDLINYEAKYDLQTVRTADLVTHIEKWLQYLDKYPQLHPDWLANNLDWIWDTLSLTEKVSMAERSLLSSVIKPHLDEDWQKRLLKASLSQLTTFELLNKQARELYESYISYQELTAEERGLIGGSLALTTRNFYDKSVVEVQHFMSRLDAGTYRQEAEKLVQRFFAPEINLNAHLDMLQATYIYKYERIFWEIYWAYFKQLLLDPRRAIEAVALMSFWFEESLPIFSEQPYLGPTFFIELSFALEDLKKAKEFKRAAAQFDSLASKHAWYSLISHYFQGKKKFFGLLG